MFVMADSDRNQQSSNAPRPETGSLADQIRKAREGRLAGQAVQNLRQNEMTGAGKAFRLASEFVAAVIVGAALGLAVDAIFGTGPIFMIVLLLLGFAAGTLNVVRAAAEMNANAPQPNPDDLVPVDDDDDED